MQVLLARLSLRPGSSGSAMGGIRSREPKARGARRGVILPIREKRARAKQPHRFARLMPSASPSEQSVTSVVQSSFKKTSHAWGPKIPGVARDEPQQFAERADQSSTGTGNSPAVSNSPKVLPLPESPLAASVRAASMTTTSRTFGLPRCSSTMAE